MEANDDDESPTTTTDSKNKEKPKNENSVSIHEKNPSKEQIEEGDNIIEEEDEVVSKERQDTSPTPKETILDTSIKSQSNKEMSPEQNSKPEIMEEDITLEQQLFGNMLSEDEDDEDDERNMEMDLNREESGTKQKSSMMSSEQDNMTSNKNDIFDGIFGDSPEEPKLIEKEEEIEYSDGSKDIEENEMTWKREPTETKTGVIKVMYQELPKKKKVEEENKSFGKKEKIYLDKFRASLFRKPRKKPGTEIELPLSPTRIELENRQLIIEEENALLLKALKTKLKYDPRKFEDSYFEELELDRNIKKAAKKLARDKINNNNKRASPQLQEEEECIENLEEEKDIENIKEEEVEKWYSSEEEVMIPTVRWRRNQETGEIESNATVVQWDDDTYSFYVGEHCFDLTNHEANTPDTFFMYAKNADFYQAVAQVKEMWNLDMKTSETQENDRRHLSKVLEEKKKKRTEGKTREQVEKVKQDEKRAIEEAEKKIKERKQNDRYFQKQILEASVKSIDHKRGNIVGKKRKNRNIEEQSFDNESQYKKDIGEASNDDDDNGALLLLTNQKKSDLNDAILLDNALNDESNDKLTIEDKIPDELHHPEKYQAIEIEEEDMEMRMQKRSNRQLALDDEEDDFV